MVCIEANENHFKTYGTLIGYYANSCTPTIVFQYFLVQ